MTSKTSALILAGCLTSLMMSFLGSLSAFAASAVFLGLSGQVTDVDSKALLLELETTFATPLQAYPKDIKTYYNMTTDGTGHFSLGLISESMSANGNAPLAAYINGIEQAGFHGIPVSFPKVDRIQESVDLIAGVHRPGSDDGTFDSNSETRKTFMLTSLSDWEKFTDTVGDALLSKNSNAFQNYLKFFFGDAAAFQTYADQVLIHDDVVLAELDPTLFLEGGGQIDPDSPVSPFFDMPFARNCWSADFEHGMCYSARSH